MRWRLLPVTEKRLLQGADFRANQRTRGDVVPPKPAFIDFQNVADVGGGGGDRVGVLWRKIVNFLNHAVGTDVGGGKRVGTIFHPEIRLLRKWKNKQHGALVCDVGAEHHASLFLALRGGQFGIECLCAQINLHLGQGRLRVRGFPRRRLRWRVTGFFATRRQGQRQEQHEILCQFHATKLPEAKLVFNRK